MSKVRMRLGLAWYSGAYGTGVSRRFEICWDSIKGASARTCEWMRALTARHTGNARATHVERLLMRCALMPIQTTDGTDGDHLPSWDLWRQARKLSVVIDVIVVNSLPGWFPIGAHDSK